MLTAQPATETKQETATPTSKTEKTGKVKTGDTQNIAVWLTMLVVAGVGAAGIVVYKKRKKADVR